MTMRFQVPGSRFQVTENVTGSEWRVTGIGSRALYRVTRHPSLVTRSAFTLVEMLVTLVLLSLIVLALMAVFNSTQKAFRASLTQTDILESGRLAMGLIASDLEGMTPSYGTNLTMYPGYRLSVIPLYTLPPVNFYANVNYDPSTYGLFGFSRPLIQALPATTAQRTNILENFFILSRQNVNGSPSWVGTGYVVDPTSSPTGALYRFAMTMDVIDGNPAALASNFIYAVNNPYSEPFTNTTYWSHLMDGVVDLTVRPYDLNGFEMTNNTYVYNGSIKTNTTYFAPAAARSPLAAASRVYGFYMFSNTVPASVEVELGVLEDHTLQHAESLPNVAPVYAQTAYLSNHVGQVHIFRQRVWIRNIDPTAYQ